MSEVLIYLVSFLIFTVLQSWFINGVKEAFNEGFILHPVKKKLSKHIKEFWLRPFFGCIRCMASFYSAITFFPLTIYLFGFRWEEIPVYIFNVGILIYLNFYFYKRQ